MEELLVGNANLTPEIALPLTGVLGGSERLWLGLQKSFDDWQVAKI